MRMINSAIPREEYPRPQFARSTWMNLNGVWQFEMDLGASGLYGPAMDTHRNAYCGWSGKFSFPSARKARFPA